MALVDIYLLTKYAKKGPDSDLTVHQKASKNTGGIRWNFRLYGSFSGVVLWAVYFMLDGFDFGAGILHSFLGKNETEKGHDQHAIGPVWNGNEVWLITAGGATFAAFPTTYALMFSYLYTALLLILFALIFRGVALEFRGKGEGTAGRRAGTRPFPRQLSSCAARLASPSGTSSRDCRWTPKDITGPFLLC